MLRSVVSASEAVQLTTTEPESRTASSAGAVMSTVGGVVSTVNVTESSPSPLPPSVAQTYTSCSPSLRSVNVAESPVAGCHEPSSSLTCTVASPSETVHSTVTESVLRRASSSGAVMVTAIVGAANSTVNSTPAVPSCPASSVARMSTV